MANHEINKQTSNVTHLDGQDYFNDSYFISAMQNNIKIINLVLSSVVDLLNTSNQNQEVIKGILCCYSTTKIQVGVSGAIEEDMSAFKNTSDNITVNARHLAKEIQSQHEPIMDSCFETHKTNTVHFLGKKHDDFTEIFNLMDVFCFDFSAATREQVQLIEMLISNSEYLFCYCKDYVEKKNEVKNEYKKIVELQEVISEQERMASLGRLVAGVAHEINTPVGITLTSASHLDLETSLITEKLENGTIKKSEFNLYLDTARECCKLVLSNSERAANLIQSFKSVAVDQSSEIQREFNLHDYLIEVITTLTPNFNNKKIKVDIKCDKDILLNSYPGSLAQVIINLVDNSRIHGYDMGKDSGVILIEAYLIDGQNVMITVSDKGKGIPEKNINRIFEPFFSTIRSTGGSGLGLSIVYNIVRKQLSGNIEVHSEEGVGTCFFMNIPIKV